MGPTGVYASPRRGEEQRAEGAEDESPYSNGALRGTL